MKKAKVAGLAKKIMALAKGAAGKKSEEKAALAKIGAMIASSMEAETKSAVADFAKQVRGVVDKAAPKTVRKPKPTAKSAKPAAKAAKPKSAPRIGKNGKKPVMPAPAPSAPAPSA